MKKISTILAALMLCGLTNKAQYTWSFKSLPPDAPAGSSFNEIWTKVPGEIYVSLITRTTPPAVSGTSLYFYNGSWNKIFELTDNCNIGNVFGTANNDVFFTLYNYTTNTPKMYHYNGSSCVEQVLPSLGSDVLRNIVGEANNVYTAAGTKIYRYDGTSWQLSATLSGGHDTYSLVYIGPNEIYSVTCWGHTLWNGINWTWYQSFDFCDVAHGWGIRDSANILHLYGAGNNNNSNGNRVWKFTESSPGSNTGSWGTKYECTYLCDPPGYGQSNTGGAAKIYGASPTDIYVTGRYLSTLRYYHYTGTFPFQRMTDFDTISNSPYASACVTGTGPSDVWFSIDTKLAHKTLIDNVAPTAAITLSDPDGIVNPGAELTITATFSEPMADSPVPQISLNGANTLSATNMTKVSSTVYTYTYTVANGSGTVNIVLPTGKDLAGNVVVSTPTSGSTFTITPIPTNGVAINNDGSLPDGNVMLDIKSTNKGILIPRIDFNDRPTSNLLSGILIYVIANGPQGNNAFYYYDGTTWVRLAISNK